MTWAELLARLWRIMTPALPLTLLVLLNDVTRAVMVPSPVSCWCVKRNSSTVVQMSAPLAVMV